MIRKSLLLGLLLFIIFGLSSGHALTVEGAATSGPSASLFLWIAIILLAAKVSGLVEWIGQPSVLGELVMGIILGNLALVGITFFEPIKTDAIIAFLAQLGVVILLFQIGLESNIQEMRKVGPRAFLVALIGVVAPFLLGTYVVGPLLLPDLSPHTYLFLGAALTATSVGITARVFHDLGRIHDKEAHIVLEAAVIDDVLGLILLAIISAIITVGGVSIASIGWIVFKALLFLAGAIIVGQLLAPQLGKLFSMISTGVGMKFTLAFSFGLTFAFVAENVGLEPIIGAFAAGLVLDPVHFRYFKDPQIIQDVKKSITNANKLVKQRVFKVIYPHAQHHVEDIMEPVGLFVIPVFFVMTGMAVNLEVLADVSVLLIALGITLAALLGKIASGLAAGKVRKFVVGWGMAPRGEVGLIFATIGKSMGVISDTVFSILVVVVIITTLLTPPVLAFLLKQEERVPRAMRLKRDHSLSSA